MSDPLPQVMRAGLEAYASRLREAFGTRLHSVRLFGSWARGEATERSDLDVAVLIDALTRNEWREAISLAVDIDIDAGVTIAPYVVSMEEYQRLRSRGRRIARDVDREGVPL